nr:hypothetical protein [Haloprofundus salinisoli]
MTDHRDRKRENARSFGRAASKCVDSAVHRGGDGAAAALDILSEVRGEPVHDFDVADTDDVDDVGNAVDADGADDADNADTEATR